MLYISFNIYFRKIIRIVSSFTKITISGFELQSHDISYQIHQQCQDQHKATIEFILLWLGTHYCVIEHLYLQDYWKKKLITWHYLSIFNFTTQLGALTKVIPLVSKHYFSHRHQIFHNFPHTTTQNIHLDGIR